MRKTIVSIALALAIACTANTQAHAKAGKVLTTLDGGKSTWLERPHVEKHNTSTDDLPVKLVPLYACTYGQYFTNCVIVGWYDINHPTPEL